MSTRSILTKFQNFFVLILYRWLDELYYSPLLLCGIWYYIFLLNFFCRAPLLPRFEPMMRSVRRERIKKEEKMIEDTIFSRLQEFLKHADWPIYIPRWKKQYGHWARKLGFLQHTEMMFQSISIFWWLSSFSK